MSLESILGECQQLLNRRKPGTLDSALHRDMIAKIDQLARFEQLYMQALSRVVIARRCLFGACEQDRAIAAACVVASVPVVAPVTAPVTPRQHPLTPGNIIGMIDRLQPPVVNASHPPANPSSRPENTSKTPARDDSRVANTSKTPASGDSRAAKVPKTLANPSSRAENAPRTSVCTSVNLTPQTSLPAVRVGDFADVRADGQLYYVANADQFAFVLCDHLFHGNIGTIYGVDTGAGTTHLRVYDCKYRDCKHRHDGTCMWYHDPTRYPGSRERRNWHNGSMCYTPAARPHGNGVHVGSLLALDDDVAHADATARTIMSDRAVHDALVALVLAHTKK